MAQWFATESIVWFLSLLGFVIVGGIISWIIMETIDNGIAHSINWIVMTILFVIVSLLVLNWYRGTNIYERSVIEHQSKMEGVNRIVEVYDRDCNILKETHEGNIYVNYEGNYVEVHLEDERILYNNSCVITKEK
jgi:hypothetical protein